MPRIVSGVREDFEDPGLAFLAGHEHATQRGKEQRAAQMEQMRLGLQIQDAARKYELQKAKALEDVNARVQMGDVNAWVQQARELEAANKHPDQQWFERGVGIRANLTPGSDAEKFFDTTFDKATQGREKQKHYAAAEQAIQEGLASGLIETPKEGQVDEFTMRLQSGEEPQNVTQEIGKRKQERTLANMALEKNTLAIEQSKAAIAAAPDSPEKLSAEYALQEYLDNPTKHTEPGSGATLVRTVSEKLLAGNVSADAEQLRRQKAIAASQAEERKRVRELDTSDKKAYAETRQGSYGSAKIAGNAGDVGDPGKTPQMEREIASLKAEKAKRYPAAQGFTPPPPAEEIGYGFDFAQQPGAAQGNMPDADSVLANLEANGLDIDDPEVQAQALAAIRGGGAPPGR